MLSILGPHIKTVSHAHHRFDALGLIHKLDIDGADGTVTYCSRKLNRGTEAFIREHGSMPLNGGTFGQPPDSSLMGRAVASLTGQQRSCRRFCRCPYPEAQNRCTAHRYSCKGFRPAAHSGLHDLQASSLAKTRNLTPTMRLARPKPTRSLPFSTSWCANPARGTFATIQD